MAPLIALLAHAGPDGGLHDAAWLLLGVPWTVVLTVVVSWIRKRRAR